MDRSASAQWRGNFRQGQGTIEAESGALSNLSYSFAKRFGDEKGTNPEELIAAAHASCFSMAFAAELEKNKMEASSIDVKAQVSLKKVGEGFEIPSVVLNVSADVPGGTEEAVRRCAESAKTNCPVSKLLNADISMNFQFSSESSVSMN